MMEVDWKGGRNMLTNINGMAVLMVRVTCVLMSAYLLRAFDWKKLLRSRYAHYDLACYGFFSVAIGHLVGSFFVIIIELLQQLLMSQWIQ